MARIALILGISTRLLGGNILGKPVSSKFSTMLKRASRKGLWLMPLESGYIGVMRPR